MACDRLRLLDPGVGHPAGLEWSVGAPGAGSGHPDCGTGGACGPASASVVRSEQVIVDRCAYSDCEQVMRQPPEAVSSRSSPALTVSITRCSLTARSKSVLTARPGEPRRALRCGAAVARETARAPSGRDAERGGGEAGVGPPAAERGTQRLRSALAPGPGRLPGAAPAMRRLPCPGARGAGNRGRPRRAAPGQSAAVLGPGQLGSVVQALP